MNIEIKKSQKPVKYEDALKFMEKRLLEIHQKKSNDLIWILEHEDLYTAGTSYKNDEILDKSIKILKSKIGKKGFGYDPIFKPLNKKITFGQMAKIKKINMDHRFIAFKKLKKKVKI